MKFWNIIALLCLVGIVSYLIFTFGGIINSFNREVAAREYCNGIEMDLYNDRDYSDTTAICVDNTNAIRIFYKDNSWGRSK